MEKRLNAPWWPGVQSPHVPMWKQAVAAGIRVRAKRRLRCELAKRGVSMSVTDLSNAQLLALLRTFTTA